MSRPLRSRLLQAHDPAVRPLATMAVAVVAVLLTFVEAYEIGAPVALVAIMTGGWSQLVSKNRSERFETISAVLVAVVALAVCVRNADFPSWF